MTLGSTFVGSRYARFRSFWFTPRETFGYTMSALLMEKAPEYAGHNPMGALMVYTMLVVLPINLVSGVMLYGVQRLSGPLEGVVPSEWEGVVEAVHLHSVTLMLGLITVHVLGTLWASWWHRENYIWAMITGNKSRYHRREKRTSAVDRHSS